MSVKMKRVITFLILIITIAFVLYSKFVTRIYHKEIKVYASISLIHHEISSLDNIAKWYLPFAVADTTSNKIVRKDKLEYNNATLTLTKLTNLTAWYQVSENNKSENITLDLVIDTAQSVKIILSFKSSLWSKMFGTNKIIMDAEKSLQNLNDYFADTKKMYGYQIEITTVRDTAFLFTSKVVAKTDKRVAFKNLFDTLIHQAAKNDFGYNGVRIFYISPYGNDSLHLFTSIGIVNTQKVGYTGEFVLKKMPFTGRLLTAYYQGSFGNVDKVINALNEFQTDNNMTQMAIPFIKLITEGTEFDDSQIIQANAFYPVF
jgi:effector-binding domain-containing protein